MDVVVYFRKRRMIFLIGLLLGGLLLVVFFPPLLALGLQGTFRFNSEGLVLLLIFLFFGSPVFWQACCALFLHQPALTVSHTGIAIRPVTVPGRFFIPWSEMQCISVHPYYAYTYLCIHPKDSSKYLASFPPLTRFVTHIWTRRGLPLLSVPLLYLDTPDSEIFHQFSSAYASELDAYHIVLQP